MNIEHSSWFACRDGNLGTIVEDDGEGQTMWSCVVRG